MNATPEADRIELPNWVHELSQAKHKEAGLRRAKNIARAALSA